MPQAPDVEEALAKRFKAVAAGAGAIAALIGGVFLLLWLSGGMTYAGLHAITIKTNASLCLLLCGIALTLAVPESGGWWRRGAVLLLALPPVLIGTLTLIEHLSGIDLDIDEMLAKEAAGAVGILHPNRMGPPGALSFTLCGIAIILAAVGAKAAVWAAQKIGLVLCLIAMLGMLGYLFHVEGLYGAARFTTIAWQTTIAIFLLGLSVLCLRPRMGLMAYVTAANAGGVAIRRLIVPAVVMPVVLGWLRLQGEWHHLYEPYFGTSILVLSVVIVFSFLIYKTGKRLGAVSAAEADALAELQRVQARFLESERLSHTGAWEYEIAGGAWTVSEEWMRIHGVSKARLSDQELLPIAHPDDRQAIVEGFEKVRGGISPYQLEHRIIRQNTGEVRTVRSRGQFVKDRTGKVVRVYGFVQDVTEEKRAREELHLQRQLLESVVTHLPAGVLIVRGSDLRILVVNPAYEDFAPGKEMLNRTVEEVWPEIQPAFGDLLRRVLETGEPYHAVDEPFLLRRAPEAPLEARFFTWSLHPVQLPGEEGMGLLVSVWETSDRKHTEEALRESENRLRNIIEHMAEGLAVIDPGTGAVHWNRKALEMYQFGPEDISASFVTTFAAIYEILTLDRRPVPVEQWPVSRLLRGEDVSDLELVVRARDGRWEHIHSYSGVLVPDGDGRVLMGILNIRDITEHKHAEEALRESEELLRTVLENLPVGVWIVERDGRILHANKAAHEIWGGARLVRLDEYREYKGWRLDTGEPIAPEEWGGYRAVTRGETTINEEVEIEAFDGTHKIIADSAVPIRNEKGEVTGAITINQDITSRKRAEEELRKSAKRLNSVIEHLAEGLIVIDPQGGALHWNRRALEMFRYGGQEEEIAFFDTLVDKFELRTLDGELIAIEEWPIKRIMRGEDYRDYELIVSHKARQWRRIYRFTGGLIPGAAGEPVMGLLTMRDITAKREAEAAVRESESLIRTVLETLPVAVWIMDRQGNVLQANKAAHDIWAGIKYVGIEGFGEYKGWWLDSGKRIEAEEWGGARAIAKGETSINEEVEIECFDGSHKIVLNSSIPIRNEKGEITGAITIEQDITAAKEAEAALRESERKFRAVFERAGVGMGRVGFANARWIDVNKAFCHMLGYSAEEMRATPWPQMTHPEDVDLDLIPFRKMAAGELDSYTVEKRFIHKEGRNVWARLTLSLVRDPQGNPDYEIAVIEDITYRKEAEEALRKAKDELELRVRERTRELEAAYADLKRETEERITAVEGLRKNEQLLIQQSRLAAMGEMLGNIAHQWRQPLNILGLLIQQLPLTLELGELTQERLEEDVAKAMQVILHMSQTINDFRDFLQEEKEKRPFSLNNAIATTISLFEATLKTLDVDLEIRQGEEIFANGHRNEFSQVVMNIITNARDAFREREIGSPKIVIGIFREEGRAVVTIADNAGGIPEEIMDKIFEPYFTTKGPDKGTGIGLFMSKNIIEKSMDGTLTVRNVGEGAEFRIELQ